MQVLRALPPPVAATLPGCLLGGGRPEARWRAGCIRCAGAVTAVTTVTTRGRKLLKFRTALHSPHHTHSPRWNIVLFFLLRVVIGGQELQETL